MLTNKKLKDFFAKTLPLYKTKPTAITVGSFIIANGLQVRNIGFYV